MTKTSLKSFNKGADAPKALVLNFVFWSFEFVLVLRSSATSQSSIEFRYSCFAISNLLYVIYGTLY